MAFEMKVVIELPSFIRRRDPGFNRTMRIAMNVATGIVRDEAKRRSPVGALGILRQSLRKQVKFDGRDIEGIVFSGNASLKQAGAKGGTVGGLPYSIPVERGRRPGSRPPPIAPIILWLKRVRKTPDETVRAEAFALAKSIGRRGIQATNFLAVTGI